MTGDILDRLIVWSGQRIAGDLTIDRAGAMQFLYAPDWLDDPSGVALSHALPKRQEPFGDALCKAVFAGLLPEEGQRTAIARVLGVSPDNPFRLLAALGGDVAGALAFLSEGEVPPTTPAGEPAAALDDAELAALIERLPRVPMLAGEGGARLGAAFGPEAAEALLAILPFGPSLTDIRVHAYQLTPAEALDAVLHIEGLGELIGRWGGYEQRLHNLEALRALAETYQDEQRIDRQAATLTGLCAWLGSRTDAAQPQSLHPEAVQLLTYHGGKGLEWPVTILTELESEAKGSPFGLFARNETEPNWQSPLDGRVLHYWPWPYGDQKKDIGLDTSAALSPEGIHALASERLERTRLLYVGMTRARDYQIVALTGRPTAWLNELCDDEDQAHVSLAADRVGVGGLMFASRGAPVAPEADESIGVDHERPAVVRVEQRPLRLNPSKAVYPGTVAIGERHSLGQRLTLVGKPDMNAVGEACHRFFAYDDLRHDTATRTERAAWLLKRWSAPELAPGDLLEASRRLHVFLTSRFPSARFMREWPVHASRDAQLIAGRIDLLVETADGYVVLDHKSFPGIMVIDGERLQAFAGQAALYAQALEAVTGRPCHEFWLHQPIAATITRVVLS